MAPFFASSILLAAWALSWGAAALWTRRTTARPSRREQLAHLIPTVAGAALMLGSIRVQAGLEFAGRRAFPFSDRLWDLPEAASWVLAGFVAAGIAFMWWARLTLGDLWSGSVTRKQGHQLIERGPYRLVRHPIYTGLLLALLAYLAQAPSLAGLAGFGLLAVGLWRKARLEERFLIAGLGEGPYADYRRRTPMLVPFWPLR